MSRKLRSSKSTRATKRTKRRIVRRTGSRKAKKSRHVVKKKRSRKKSEKVMEGDYGRGKNHKGGSAKLKDFFLQFASTTEKTSTELDRYNVTHNSDNAEYHFVSPNNTTKSLIKQQFSDSYRSLKYFCKVCNTYIYLVHSAREN